MGSSSRTDSRSSQDVSTSNLGFQGVEGVAVAGGGGATNVSITDAGATRDALAFAESVTRALTDGLDEQLDMVSGVVAGGYDVSEEALRRSVETTERAFDFGTEALDFADDNTELALNFGQDTFNRGTELVATSQREALGLADDALNQGFSFGRYILEGATKAIADITGTLGAQQTQAIAGLSAAQRTDSTKISETLIKFLTGGAAVVAAAFIFSRR